MRDDLGDFTLVKEALDYMDRRRLDQVFQRKIDENIIATDTSDTQNIVACDVLEVNMFVLDPKRDQGWLGIDATSSSTIKSPKRMQQNLACIGHRVNQLLQKWHQRTRVKNQQWNKDTACFQWNSGGNGPVFGVHIPEITTAGNDLITGNDQELLSSNRTLLPYLHTKYHYGDTISDEYLFLSLLFHLTHVLSKEFPDLLIAAEAIDQDQIILIEGANYIPDYMQPNNSQNRVWIVDGEVVLLLPKPTLTTKKIILQNNLPRNNALLCLIQHFLPSPKNHVHKNNNEVTTDPTRAHIEVVYAPKEIKQLIFNRAITCYDKNRSSSNTVDTNLLWVDPAQLITKQYMHFAPCVLPYHLATALRLCSDYTPLAIDVFCSFVDKFERDQQQKYGFHGGTNDNYDTTTHEPCTQKPPLLPAGELITYSNLVVAVIPFSRLKYAMLMAAGSGALTTSMMPHAYRSVEAARFRRMLSNHDYLHDALEAGVRLTLGYEWLYHMEELKYTAEQSKIPKTSSMGDVEQRVLKYWIGIDHALGGDGKWIYDSWEKGPNANCNSLLSLAACPVYKEEVCNNVCPLSSPNQTLYKQLHNLFEKVTKLEQDLYCFPFPTKDMVDNDEWKTVKNFEMFEKLMMQSTMPGECVSYKFGDVSEVDEKLFQNNNNHRDHKSSSPSRSCTFNIADSVTREGNAGGNGSYTHQNHKTDDTKKSCAKTKSNEPPEENLFTYQQNDLFSDDENDDDFSSNFSSNDGSSVARSDHVDSSSEEGDNEGVISIRDLMVSRSVLDINMFLTPVSFSRSLQTPLSFFILLRCARFRVDCNG
jgi:hypothetical protein